MTSNRILLGAGAALVAFSVAANAIAQPMTLDPAPAPNPDSRTVRFAAPPPAASTSGSITAAQLNEAIAYARANGTPVAIMTAETDAFGVRRVMLAPDAARYLGGPEMVRLGGVSDQEYCSVLNQMNVMLDEIAAADAEVREADKAAAEAQTRAEKKWAKARQERARTNFIQLLLAGARIGLVSLIPGVGWAYAGIMIANEFSYFLDRRQNGVEMEAYDASMKANDARVHAFELRLKALDMRLELHTMQSKLWMRMTGGLCNDLGYTTRVSPVMSSVTPAPSAR